MPFPSDELPPRDSSYAGQFHCMFLGSPWLIKNPSHSMFTKHMHPPKENDSPQQHKFDSTIGFNIGRIISAQGRPRVFYFPGRVVAKAKVEVEVNFESKDKTGTTRTFTTELKRLDADDIRIGKGRLSRRASLKLSELMPSLGKTTITETKGGQFAISSYFDVSTKLSTDGGKRWHESVSLDRDSITRERLKCAARMTLNPDPKPPGQTPGPKPQNMG